METSEKPREMILSEEGEEEHQVQRKINIVQQRQFRLNVKEKNNSLNIVRTLQSRTNSLIKKTDATDSTSVENYLGQISVTDFRCKDKYF